MTDTIDLDGSTEKSVPPPHQARLIRSLMAGIAPVIAEHVRSALAPLVRRLEELEAHGQSVKYMGIWDSKTQYEPGSFVTDKGSVWHCNDTTRARPGDSPAWTLAVKRGADGRDAR
jgi:hypothetical protein